MKSSREAAEILWNYHNVKHELQKSDAIFVPGHNDVRFAERAAELYHKGLAPFIIFSGANSPLTSYFGQFEALYFKSRALELGVPEEAIITESNSTNTEQNIREVKLLLKKNDVNIQQLIVLQRPFLSKRVYLTLQKFWPEVNHLMDTHQYNFDDYVGWFGDEAKLIEQLMGNTKRVALYSYLDWTVPEEVESEVVEAYRFLKSDGYKDNFPEDVINKLRAKGVVTEL